MDGNKFLRIIILVFIISKAGLAEIPPLRCCTLIEAPMVVRDKTNPIGFEGLAFEYLNQLQKSSTLRCKGSIKIFREGKDTGFTDFIHHMESCTTQDGLIKNDKNCQCDIGIAGFGLNSERLGRVNYLPAFAFDQYAVLTHSDNFSPVTGDAFFLTTFSVTVWICIFALLVCFTILKMLDRRFSPVEKTDEQEQKHSSSCPSFKKKNLLKWPLFYRLRRAFESTSFRFILQPSPGIQGDHNSTRQRFLNFIVSLVGLFLALTYEASMTASLLVEERASEFRSVDDLKNCRILPREICIPEGGAVESFWDNAIYPNLQDRCVGDYGEVYKTKTYTELTERVANRTCKFGIALKSTLAWAAMGNLCGQVEIDGKPFQNGQVSFVLPKGSPYTEELSQKTLDLRTHDSISAPGQYISGKFGECHPKSQPLITFRKLRVFFILAFSLVVLIFFEMVLDPQDDKSQENDEDKDERRNVEECDCNSGSSISAEDGLKVVGNVPPTKRK